MNGVSSSTNSKPCSVKTPLPDRISSPSELCIFRIVRIIGRQTALDCEQILSADFAHIAYVPNKRVTVEIKTQIDEVGQVSKPSNFIAS